MDADKYAGSEHHTNTDAGGDGRANVANSHPGAGAHDHRGAAYRTDYGHTHTDDFGAPATHADNSRRSARACRPRGRRRSGYRTTAAASAPPTDDHRHPSPKHTGADTPGGRTAGAGTARVCANTDTPGGRLAGAGTARLRTDVYTPGGRLVGAGTPGGRTARGANSANNTIGADIVP